MKSYLKYVFTLILSITTVNLLVACAPKGSDSAGSSSGGGGPDAPKTLGSPGTSDSGGGSGVDSKVFDSYIVDVSTLPAYTEIVKPLLENIKSSDPKQSGIYLNTYKVRTWYVAPVDLQILEKETLGISFLKTETQQIARQSLKAVWIDKRIFDKMEKKDQADLIVHEIVMILYFAKFMTVDDLCKISKTLTDNGGCTTAPEFFERAMPAEKKRPLNEEDNENIRAVTAWLLRAAQQPIQEKEFLKVLYDNGFDHRFFNPDNTAGEDQNKKSLKIPLKDFYNIFTASLVAGYMPEFCTDRQMTINVPCEIKIRKTKISPGPGHEFPAIELSVTREGTTEIYTLPIFTDPVELYSSKISGLENWSYSSLTWKPKYSLGDRVDTITFNFKESESQPNSTKRQLLLQSINGSNGIVAGIDVTTNPVCTMVRPRHKIPFDDGFIAHRDLKDSLALESLMSLMFPFSYCIKDNVEQKDNL